MSKQPDPSRFRFAVVVVLACLVIPVIAQAAGWQTWELLKVVAAFEIVVFIGLLGAVVLAKLWMDKDSLKNLVSEKDGNASFSRFQFLVFTFVIATCLLVLTLKEGKFPEFGAQVLGLIGISGGSYVVSKGIQKSSEGAEDDDPEWEGAEAEGEIP